MLRRTVVAASLCAAFCVFEPWSHGAWARDVTEPPRSALQAPVKADIDVVFGKVVDELRQAEALAQHLRETAAKTPEDTQREVNEAAGTISRLADSLEVNGQLATRLSALRNAALVHRKRVQDLPKGTIEETDRTNLLAAWDKVVQQADAAGTAMLDMREKLLATLQKLRMRQTAVAEFLLAGQYKAALDTLMNWLTDLQGTVDGLHRAMEDAGTVLHGPDAKTS